MKKYHYSQIIEITEKGLYYLNDEHEQQFLDFSLCVQNWEEYRKNTGEFMMGENNVKNLINTYKNVGQRNWFDNPPYIEFFSTEHVRFIFPNVKKSFMRKLFSQNTTENYPYFRDINQRLLEKGYTTYDLG